MKIVLPKERPISWNKYYAGTNWRTRHEDALRVHALVKYSTLREKQFIKPVWIEITAYFAKSPLDPDNINAKILIDGLKHTVLVDDTMQWVDSVTVKSRIDVKNPRIEIYLEEI